MPCNCATIKPDYPTTDTWGPLLWTILHSLAERIGTVAPMFTNDEKQRWLVLFVGFPLIIPCKDCKEHALSYISDHPFSAWKTMAPDERRDWTRTWFYDFHEAVNARLGHSSFDKTLLTSTYGSVNIREYLDRLKVIMNVAIQLDGVPMIKWRDFSGSVLRMLALYGI